MEEDIADMLLSAGDKLHWLGKHREGNALILCARLCRAERLHTLVDLEEHVEDAENAWRSESEGEGDPR